jgi:hypothetical protein
MKSFDPGIFFSLPPGVAPMEGHAERTEAARQTTKFNKDVNHLRARIRENPSDRDAEILLAEILYGDAPWKPTTGPDRY